MNATCATACGLAAAQAELQPSRTTGQRLYRKMVLFLGTG